MSTPSAKFRSAQDVPVRTLLAAIGLVLATYVAIAIVKQVSHILELIVVAVFFAIVLNPVVDFFEHKARLRRGLATSLVFFAFVGLFTAMMYLFIRPLVDQTQAFIDRFPHLVQDARNGKGTIGHLVKHYNIDRYVQENQSKLREALTNSTSSAIDVARSVFSTVATFVTVLVLAFLMLLEGPKLVTAPLIFFDPNTQMRIRKVAADAAKAVTGYTAGNLLISLIAGLVTFTSLLILGVDFAAVLGVWVAFADLIPLVGATLGAVPTVLVATLNKPSDGIAMIVVYVVYQQFENHFLQTAIMSKTVKLNPLTVLVSVLLGVDLAGLLGALLAIPVAGILQVVGRDIFDHHTGRLKSEPTIGESETPIPHPNNN